MPEWIDEPFVPPQHAAEVRAAEEEIFAALTKLDAAMAPQKVGRLQVKSDNGERREIWISFTGGGLLGIP